jgi:hypothetical protein
MMPEASGSQTLFRVITPGAGEPEVIEKRMKWTTWQGSDEKGFDNMLDFQQVEQPMQTKQT